MSDEIAHLMSCVYPHLCAICSPPADSPLKEEVAGDYKRPLCRDPGDECGCKVCKCGDRG